MQGKAASYTKGPDQSKHGPSWRDVAMIVKELELLAEVRPTWTTKVGLSVGGLPAFQLECILGTKLVTSVGQSFVPGGISGPTTMPAAIYLLLAKVYHYLEAMEGEQRVTYLQS